MNKALLVTLFSTTLVCGARAEDGGGDPGTPAADAFTAPATTAQPKFETSAALLFLQPSSGNLVYATVTNPFPFLNPQWNNRTVSTDFNPAFNVGVRYVPDCDEDIRLDWTHLNSDNNASTHVRDPYVYGTTSGPANIQALGPPFLIGPPLPFAGAFAVAHFAYDAVNLDAGIFLHASHHVQVRPFAGIQFARLSQSVTTTFQSADQSISFTDIPRSVFTGVGPRLGVDLHYLAGNFDFLGEIAGSILLGSMHSRMDFITYSPFAVAGFPPADAAGGFVPNAQSLTSADSTRAIPAIDAKLGASYSIPVGSFGILKCEAGYQAAVYINAVNQYSVSDVENSLTEPIEGVAGVFLRSSLEYQSNFVVHGPYLKVSVDF